MMKTILPMQATMLGIADLEPGMVVAEGVVLDKRVDAYYTPAGTFLMDPTDTVAVICRITPGMVEKIVDALVKRDRREDLPVTGYDEDGVPIGPRGEDLREQQRSGR